MNRGQLAVYAARLYVVALGAVAAATLGWLFGPRFVGSPELASAWFAAAGFGLLALLAVVLAHYASKPGTAA